MEFMTKTFIAFLKEQENDVFGKYINNLFKRESNEEMDNTNTVAETADFLRLQGVENWDKDPYYKHYTKCDDPMEYISRAFYWGGTPEGYNYWQDIDNKWLEYYGTIEYTNLGKREEFDDKTAMLLKFIETNGYKAEVRTPSELYGDGYADVWYHQLALTYSEPI